MTENAINKILNSPQTPPSHKAPTNPTPSNSGGGGGETSTIDKPALRAAARTAPEVNSHIRTGSKVFPPETDRAADALGTDWATSAAMKQVSAAWLQALNRMTDEVEYLSGSLEKSADNWQKAEEQIKQEIDRIRTGGPVDMVSFAQLRDAKIGELDSAWRSWRKLVEHLENAEDTYQGKFLQGVRKAEWTGKSAEAAMRTLLPMRTRIRVASGEASAIASVLNTAQGKFQAAQNELRSAINSAESQYLKVGPDGSIDFPETLPARYTNWQELQRVAQQIQGKFVAAVKKATVVDNEIAGALRALHPDVLNRKNPLANLQKDTGIATKLAGFNPNNIPPSNLKSPKEVADWWRNLPEEQRHLMMNAYPNKIGWLDGIPSEDRDEANRTRLDSRIHDLQTKSDRNKFEESDLARLQKLSGELNRLSIAGKDPYLLGLDSTTRAETETHEYRTKDGQHGAVTQPPGGRAIVAIGNPDTALHTGVYVPGTEADLGKFDDSILRAERLYDQGLNYSNPGELSTIAWLGYDAPNEIWPHAASPVYAEEGGRRLDDFTEGLRAAQSQAGQENAHMTAVGHSYGTAVIGEATKSDGNGLGVDDIVLNASPGTRTDGADDLIMTDPNNAARGEGNPRHVWAQTSQDDDIRLTQGVPHGGLRFGWPLVVTPEDEEFGGNIMRSDTSGHSGYWDEESQSLKNQARVIVGQYNNVDLAHGRPPE
ncbi:alpha/beta hydrolase [Actinomadura sediminis]|uniref:Alpha/beta hydrolase n=1 Tax=Actinomadura sediminis TaxID=1038904 RepID=A0ABW3EMB9_9ACTN